MIHPHVSIKWDKKAKCFVSEIPSLGIRSAANTEEEARAAVYEAAAMIFKFYSNRFSGLPQPREWRVRWEWQPKGSDWDEREERFDDEESALKEAVYHLTHKERRMFEHRNVRVEFRDVTFWVPMELPIDLTVRVQPPRGGWSQADVRNLKGRL